MTGDSGCLALFLKTWIYFLTIYYSCNNNAIRYLFSTLSSEEYSSWITSSVLMNFIVREKTGLTFAVLQMSKQRPREIKWVFPSQRVNLLDLLTGKLPKPVLVGCNSKTSATDFQTNVLPKICLLLTCKSLPIEGGMWDRGTYTALQMTHSFIKEIFIQFLLCIRCYLSPRAMY